MVTRNREVDIILKASTRFAERTATLITTIDASWRAYYEIYTTDPTEVDRNERNPFEILMRISRQARLNASNRY